MPVQPDFFDTADSGERAPVLFSRLVSDYQWQPPATATLAGLTTDTEAERQDPLEARLEVVLGIVVHAALEDLAGDALPEDLAAYLQAARPRWQAMASEHDLVAADVDRVVETTEEQIRSVLEHEDGRWLLSPAPDAHSELALTAAIDGRVENLIIDRTLNDPESGERWVVDFKTAIPRDGADEAAFIRTEIGRYRPQLERYGVVASALFNQPVRLALYFTALPKLVELKS